MSIECFMEDKDVKCEIVRDDMEKLAGELLVRVEATARALVASLEAQSITLEDVASVEVVGGSTRISAVRTRLTEIFKKELSTTLNIDEVGSFKFGPHHNFTHYLISGGCARRGVASSDQLSHFPRARIRCR